MQRPRGRGSRSLATSSEAAAEGSAAFARLQGLLARGQEEGRAPGEVLMVPEAAEVVQSLAQHCGDLSAEETRQVLALCMRAQHMPPTLWSGGFADHLATCLEDLPDLHLVHIGLMMAALELRRPPELLLELTEHFDFRAASLSPTGLAGATIAISQLGPWRGPLPASLITDELSEKVDQLTARELSSSALAAATLGITRNGFWQGFHTQLLSKAYELGPDHVADALMALATTRLMPVSLLEALQERLPMLVADMGTDEALTTAWALASMGFFPKKVFARVLEQVCPAGEIADLTAAQARQLRQLLLSLELDPSASKAALEVAPALRGRLAEACEEVAGGEDCADEAVAEELGSLLLEEGVEHTFAEDVQHLYTIDVAIRGPTEAAGLGVVLDAEASDQATAPRDPWTSLKLRQLRHLGWTITWLPTERWRLWSEEERLDFARACIAEAGGRRS